ncbi:MAG: hypothetical protein IPM20_03610 [Gammaproteobacteria bacterium]|nr:hypothetical protein [Gammaproteobacteria bacterium]
MLQDILGRKFSLKYLAWLFGLGTAWLSMIMLSSPEHRMIYYVLTAASLALVWLMLFINSRDAGIRIFDVGLLCAIATLLYTAVPLLNYIAGEFAFTALSDSRLQSYQPSPYELSMFHWRHVLYIWAFVITYSLMRGRQSISQAPHRSYVSNAQLIVITTMLFAMSMYFIFIDYALGITFNPSYEELMDQRKSGAAETGPLILRQVSNYLWGMFFILKLALLYAILARYRKPMWRATFYTWMIVEIGYAIYVMGSRTQVILLLVAAVLLFDYQVRRIQLRTATIAACILLVCFLLFGYIRGLSLSDSNVAGVSILSATNEFQALLGTAFDVWKRTENGTLIAPWYVHLYDFISLFPPQQIFPFDKQSASQWYLEATDRSGISGKMWGVVSQSIIGLDWIEILVRGILLGTVCGLLHRYFVKNQESFMTVLLYLWLCLTIYYTFRATTFYATVWYLYEFIPIYIALKYLPQMLTKTIKAT